MEQHMYIGLMAHTLGSIGQIVKEESTLTYEQRDKFLLEEIKRIYDGYISILKSD